MIRYFVSILSVLILLGTAHAGIDSTAAKEKLEQITGILNKRSGTLDEHHRNMRLAITEVEALRKTSPAPKFAGVAALLASQAHFNIESYHEALGEVTTALTLPLETPHRALGMFIQAVILQKVGKPAEGAVVLWCSTV